MGGLYMINELIQITRGLADNNIQIPEKTSYIKQARKQGGFLLSLNAKTGNIEDAEFVPRDKMALLWKVSHNNHKNFPITTLGVPFYDVPNDVEFSPKDEFADALETILNNNRVSDFLKYDFSFNLKYHKKQLARFTNLFYTYPKYLQCHLNNGAKDTAFTELVNALIVSFGDEPKKIDITNRVCELIRQCATAICSSCLKGAIQEYGPVLDVLFGKYNETSNEFEEVPIQIGIHLESKKDETFHASYEKVNDALIDVTKSTTIGVDSLTGKSTNIITTTFPELYIKGFGNIKLFSMFKEVPAHFRYGHIGASTFPASEIEINKIFNTLKYITSSEMENKSWCLVPSATKDNYDLLISWLSGKAIPKYSEVIKDAIASLFKNQSDLEGITNYKTETKKIIDNLKKPSNTISLDVYQNVLLLTQSGKGKTKIIANTTHNLNIVSKNVINWAEAANNCIPFGLPIKFYGADKTVLLKPYTPSPNNIIRLLEKSYMNSGTHKRTKPISAKDILFILMEDQQYGAELENKLLRRLINSSRKLLLSIREAQIGSAPLIREKQYSRANKIMDKYSTNARLDALISIVFMEILLKRLSTERREMDSMFNMGKLLAKVDELHVEYSMHERGGIPSKLLGSSFVNLAIQNPTKALANLGKRFAIYQNWAKVYCKRKHDNRVGMLLAQIGKITRSIELGSFNGMVTDKDKALLILGYLSWEDKNENSKQRGDN